VNNTGKDYITKFISIAVAFNKRNGTSRRFLVIGDEANQLLVEFQDENHAPNGGRRPEQDPTQRLGRQQGQRILFNATTECHNLRALLNNCSQLAVQSVYEITRKEISL
jgi:hypothetical protein